MSIPTSPARSVVAGQAHTSQPPKPCAAASYIWDAKLSAQATAEMAQAAASSAPPSQVSISRLRLRSLTQEHRAALCRPRQCPLRFGQDPSATARTDVKPPCPSWSPCAADRGCWASPRMCWPAMPAAWPPTPRRASVRARPLLGIRHSCRPRYASPPGPSRCAPPRPGHG